MTCYSSVLFTHQKEPDHGCIWSEHCYLDYSTISVLSDTLKLHNMNFIWITVLRIVTEQYLISVNQAKGYHPIQ